MQRFPFWQFDRPLKRLLSFTLMFCISAIAVSCTATSPNISAPASPALSPQAVATETLNVAVIPWQSPKEQEKNLQPLADYLQQTMKRQSSFRLRRTMPQQ